MIRQYEGMLLTEGVTLEFTDEAIDEMARMCKEINDRSENIGARRLHTIMEYLLEEVSFNAPAMDGESVRVDKALVVERLSEFRPRSV